MTCDVRITVLPASRSARMLVLEHAAGDGIEPGGRLVEDQQVGRKRNASTAFTFWRVPPERVRSGL